MGMMKRRTNRSEALGPAVGFAFAFRFDSNRLDSIRLDGEAQRRRSEARSVKNGGGAGRRLAPARSRCVGSEFAFGNGSNNRCVGAIQGLRGVEIRSPRLSSRHAAARGRSGSGFRVPLHGGVDRRPSLLAVAVQLRDRGATPGSRLAAASNPKSTVAGGAILEEPPARIFAQARPEPSSGRVPMIVWR